MHVQVTNFPLDSLNILKFISVYCQAVFESTEISMLSDDFKAPYYMKLIHGEQTRNVKNFSKFFEYRFQTLKGTFNFVANLR